MKEPLISTASESRVQEPAAADTRLHGRWLLIARVGWVALALFSLASVAVRLPFYLAHLETLCATPPCAYEQITSATLRAFQQVGLSLGSYALLAGSLTVTEAVFSFVLAAIISWRRSDDWLALLLSAQV